jgi:hypothetical protein
LLPSGVILVVTKSYPPASGPTTLFEIRSAVSGDRAVAVRARRVLPPSYGTITGMDVMGDKLVLLGIIGGKGIATVLDATTYARVGIVKLPPARQSEGICFSHDGSSVLVVSEVDRRLMAVRLPAALRPAPAPSTHVVVVAAPACEERSTGATSAHAGDPPTACPSTSEVYGQDGERYADVTNTNDAQGVTESGGGALCEDTIDDAPQSPDPGA